MIAVAGILATDPNFPAKRIHIPQYFILALVLHRALSFDLPAPWIFPGAVLFAAVLGVHDELIQGLLPSRTFGLRDIGVNSLGALSGGAVGAGLSLFAARVNKDLPTPNGATLFGIGAVVIGLALMLAPLEYFRDASIPVWTITPLLAAGFALCLISWR
ncbi:MAG: VanZ family protein, partial [Rhodospirillaceae bacterium]|nr:VanZ family protein [Rhodospirillaceae bacterium]